jgi:hypothetical protein
MVRTKATWYEVVVRTTSDDKRLQTAGLKVFDKLSIGGTISRHRDEAGDAVRLPLHDLDGQEFEVITGKAGSRLDRRSVRHESPTASDAHDVLDEDRSDFDVCRKTATLDNQKTEF